MFFTQTLADSVWFCFLIPFMFSCFRTWPFYLWLGSLLEGTCRLSAPLTATTVNTRLNKHLSTIVRTTKQPWISGPELQPACSNRVSSVPTGTAWQPLSREGMALLRWPQPLLYANVESQTDLMRLSDTPLSSCQSSQLLQRSGKTLMQAADNQQALSQKLENERRYTYYNIKKAGVNWLRRHFLIPQ